MDGLTFQRDLGRRTGELFTDDISDYIYRSPVHRLNASLLAQDLEKIENEETDDLYKIENLDYDERGYKVYGELRSKDNTAQGLRYGRTVLDPEAKKDKKRELDTYAHEQIHKYFPKIENEFLIDMIEGGYLKVLIHDKNRTVRKAARNAYESWFNRQKEKLEDVKVLGGDGASYKPFARYNTGQATDIDNKLLNIGLNILAFPANIVAKISENYGTGDVYSTKTVGSGIDIAESLYNYQKNKTKDRKEAQKAAVEKENAKKAEQEAHKRARELQREREIARVLGPIFSREVNASYVQYQTDIANHVPPEQAIQNHKKRVRDVYDLLYER